MNQKKLLYIVLLLNFIHAASINASSPSTSSPLRSPDQRPIPPTIEHAPSNLQKNNPKNSSYSQMSQLYAYDISYADPDDINYIDSDNEDDKKEEKTNREIKDSALWTYYCHEKNRHVSFIMEDMPATPSPSSSPKEQKEEFTPPTSPFCASDKKQYSTFSQICAIEALLKKFQNNDAIATKSISRPRTSTI